MGLFSEERLKREPLLKALVDQMGEQWTYLLYQEFQQGYMLELLMELKKERKIAQVFPSPENTFRAFKETPLENVKVVIIGQDPYHGVGQAQGIAFSVPNNQPAPPSLKNILKEVESDVGFTDPSPEHDLIRWARQGVLLLNTSLTVRYGLPGSHSTLADRAWPRFTRAVLEHLSDHYSGQKDLFDFDSGPRRNLVFLLWGNHARQLKDACKPQLHTVVESAHPSPFSAHKGFFGTKPFSKVNVVLEKNGLTPISW